MFRTFVPPYFIMLAFLCTMSGVARSQIGEVDITHCTIIDEFMDSRAKGAVAPDIIRGDEVKRASLLYDSLNGDKLAFVADGIFFMYYPSGGMRIAYTYSGLVCTTLRIPPWYIKQTVDFINNISI